MENLVELVTYNDEQFGLVSQFLDNNDNTIFFHVTTSATGEKNYEKVSDEINNILIRKYFSIVGDLDE